MFHNDLILGQLLPNIFINDFMIAITYSACVLFADNIKIVHYKEILILNKAGTLLTS